MIEEIIKKRSAVYPKSYNGEIISKEVLLELLDLANRAPSHRKTEPWRFQVFQSEASRNALSQNLGRLYMETTPDKLQNDTKLAKLIRRPLISSVVIAVNMSRQIEEKIPEIEEIEAVSCAIQNMQLTANAYGIGAFWSTPKLIYTSGMNTYLNIKEKDKCLGLIYLGYTREEWPKSHRKPIEYNTIWKTP